MYLGAAGVTTRRVSADLWHASGARPSRTDESRGRPHFQRTSTLLGTVLAVQLRRSRTHRELQRRRAKVRRRALLDDLSQAVDEVGNTVEDALLHFFRLPAWLSSDAADSTPGAEGRCKVVVLGTGWAAHAIAKIIDVSKVDVTVVSPRNYFIFTPMLAAASVGTVEYRSILEHIRSSNPTIGYCQGRRMLSAE